MSYALSVYGLIGPVAGYHVWVSLRRDVPKEENRGSDYPVKDVGNVRERMRSIIFTLDNRSGKLTAYSQNDDESAMDREAYS
jgi:hypothetical protein